MNYMVQLSEMGVDALILQEFGFAKLVREYLPAMEIHLSTQGTVYNEEGVKAAENFSFSY